MLVFKLLLTFSKAGCSIVILPYVVSPCKIMLQKEFLLNVKNDKCHLLSVIMPNITLMTVYSMLTKCLNRVLFLNVSFNGLSFYQA
jgi:hypothetical protein